MVDPKNMTVSPSATQPGTCNGLAVITESCRADVQMQSIKNVTGLVYPGYEHVHAWGSKLWPVEENLLHWSYVTF